ncbi:enoyl-CoA hydratase [Aeromicrobium sp. SMF47]|nr:enoyl-CoA hydratase [Aeromicrobium yanjiei]MRK01638.1 enoyl-CoA hydratase [Aeromicrobium sp. S22]
MTSNDVLLSERFGSTLWLTLNRPERRNALTVDLVRQLADAIGGCDAEVRCIVLTGSGSAFCAGGDLTDLSAVAEGGARVVTDVIYSQFQRLVRALAEAPCPVIAAVNGPALGAGLDLAMACDLRVSSTEAVFASSWIGVGLVPGMGGAHLLSRAIGTARATEMVLMGERVSPQTALEWGLVNKLVAAGELRTTVDAMTDHIGSLSAAAIKSSKESLQRAMSLGFEQELAILGATQGGLLTGQEFRDATARFRKKDA